MKIIILYTYFKKGKEMAKSNLFTIFTITILTIFTGCGNYRDDAFKNNHSIQNSFREYIPINSNLELGGERGIIYYADPKEEEGGYNRVLRIDTNSWSYKEIYTDGINPHSIDRAGDSDRFYIRTQDSESFDIVNFKTNEVKTVWLDGDRPRSIGATNLKYHIQLLPAKFRPLIYIIDTDNDRVIGRVGDDFNYYNSTANGHTGWLDADHFVLIDRPNQLFSIYRVVESKRGLDFIKTQTIRVETKFHGIMRVANADSENDLYTFYGFGEGDADNGILPYVIKLRFDPHNGTFQKIAKTSLPFSNKIIKGVKPVTHHAGITPDGNYLLVPTKDGNLYIIDRFTMKIKKRVKVGLGAGHVYFSKSRNLALVTNHFDKYISVIDLKNLEVIKHIYITDKEYHDHSLQPHTSYVMDGGKYFYTFSSQDGDLVKIDLDTLKVIKRLHVGGAPEQGHS
jgi:DNA-binding beta-propeller fold protein YncE